MESGHAQIASFFRPAFAGCMQSFSLRWNFHRILFPPSPLHDRAWIWSWFDLFRPSTFNLK